jgi:hypothetical protein
MSGRGLAVVGAVATALSAARVARADGDNERYALRAELGAEYDSNAHRTEIVNGFADNPPIISSPLARGVLSGSLADVIADGQELAMSATVAGKLFTVPAAREENVIVAESALNWRAALGPRTSLALAGAYYEAFQRPDPDMNTITERRDFRSLTPSVRLGRALGARAELGLTAGYRWFVFKADPTLDFQAPTLAVDLRWTRESTDGSADWELAGGAGFEHRTFVGSPFFCVDSPACHDLQPGPGTRVDDFLIAHAELTHTGRVLLGGGYAFHLNNSNSYAETVQRHFLTARLGAALPFDIFLAARAEILLAFYAEPVPLGADSAGRTYISIEDENRSSVRVDLSRNLTERLQLIARYTFYANEITASTVSYRRQTALLSLAFTFEK